MRRRIVACRVRGHRFACGRGLCAGLSVAEQGARLAGDGLLGVVADRKMSADLTCRCRSRCRLSRRASAGLLAFPLAENMLLARLLQQRVAADRDGDRRRRQQRDDRLERGRDGQHRRAIASSLSGCVGARAARGRRSACCWCASADSAAALVPTAGIVSDTCDGIDLAQPEYTVQLDAVSVPAENLLAEGTWSKLQSDAFVLRAAAILGSAETCLALAQEHVSHAASVRPRACPTIKPSVTRSRGTSSRSKASAKSIARALFADSGLRERRSAFLAASAYGVAISEGAVQMHGGMGFTWDVPVHRHVRRIRALQAQGDASGVLAALGHDYIAEVKPAREHAAA